MSPDKMVKGKRYEVTYQLPSLHTTPRKLVATFDQRVSYSTHKEYDFIALDGGPLSMEAPWFLDIQEVKKDTTFCYNAEVTQ